MSRNATSKLLLYTLMLLHGPTQGCFLKFLTVCKREGETVGKYVLTFGRLEIAAAHYRRAQTAEAVGLPLGEKQISKVIATRLHYSS